MYKLRLVTQKIEHFVRLCFITDKTPKSKIHVCDSRLCCFFGKPNNFLFDKAVIIIRHRISKMDKASIPDYQDVVVYQNKTRFSQNNVFLKLYSSTCNDIPADISAAAFFTPSCPPPCLCAALRDASISWRKARAKDWPTSRPPAIMICIKFLACNENENANLLNYCCSVIITLQCIVSWPLF